MSEHDAPGHPAAVTELALLRERVARLEEQLVLREEVIDQQTEWICRFRPDGTLTFVNRAYAEGLQLAPEQLIGRTFFDFIPPDEQPVARAHLAALGPLHPVATIEHRVHLPDGRIRWDQWTDHAVLDAQGQVVEIQSVGRDITARKQAQIQLIAERDLAQGLAGTSSLDVAMPICLDIAIRVAQMDCGGFYLSDPATGDLCLVYTRNLSAPFVAQTRRWPAHSSRARLVAQGQPSYGPYPRAGIDDPEIDTCEGLRALAVLPLSYQGRNIGCLNIGSHTYADVPPEARSSLEAIAAQVGHAIIRIQTEEALRSSQQEWQSLFDSLQDFLFVLDYDGTILRVNRLVLQRLGYSEDELVGQSVLMVHPPERHAEALAIISGMLAGQLEICPLALVARDGRQIPVETRVTCGRWGGRKALFGVSRDISEHLRIETALRESEARLRALVHNFPNGAVFLFDHDLRYLVADGHELTSIGRTSGAIEGRTLPEVLAPDSVAILEPIYRAALAGSAPIDVELAIGSGWYHLSAVPIRDAAGITVAGLIIALNISEQKRTRAILGEQAQAMAALRERERLARELHDSLGQVLAYVNIQTQAIRDCITGGRITKAAASLASLTAVVQESQLDVREFILAARGQHPAEPRAQQTAGLLPALKRHLVWVAEVYGLRTDLAIDPGVEALVISPLVEVQLLRIAQEALSNVRRHAAVLHAALSLRLEDDRLALEVRDEGQGFVLPDAGAGVGRGFGLQGLHERAEEIGASLVIASAVGQGTLVRLEVPLQRLAAQAVAELRVLLVDDNPLFLQALQQLLQSRGFVVVGAVDNGSAALEWARVFRPDVILMDIVMPGISGIEAMRMILAEMPELHIVMLTASESEASLVDAIKAGAAGYLLKSMEADDLCNQLLGISRGEAALSGDLALRVLRDLAAQSADEQLASEELTATLTRQELKVLTLLAQGFTYRAIARLLDYSERAIKYHTGNAIKKLHLETRTAAVAFVRQQVQRGLWPQAL